jgi:demethylmenaquinone methyltransferase / 2-methoxy-6-polyprenyl-1,4-benzoquinol methylase
LGPLPFNPFSKLYDSYSFNIIPLLGQAIANDPQPYRYLVESIRRFPPPEELSRQMRAAGFAGVNARSVGGGVVYIHEGFKF